MADSGDREQAEESDGALRRLARDPPGMPAPSALPGPVEARPEHGIQSTTRAAAIVLCAVLVLCVALSPVLIGRITSQHATRSSMAAPRPTVYEYALPHARSLPFGITVGPDRNMWFTEYDAHMIGRITLQGHITEFALPAGSSSPFDIVSGPDGNLWFSQQPHGYSRGLAPTPREATQ